MKPGDLVVDFHVPATPQVAGNKTPRRTKDGRIFIVERTHEETRSWKQSVALFGSQAYSGEPLDIPLEVWLVFFRPRPKHHFRQGRYAGELKTSAPDRPKATPDLTKLARSTEDALTGIVWIDDSRIVDEHLHKGYHTHACCRIIVRVAGPLPILPSTVPIASGCQPGPARQILPKMAKGLSSRFRSL